VIESIGYTDDGFVWMKILFDINGDKNCMIITVTQDKAREISDMLVLASDEAKRKVMQ